MPFGFESAWTTTAGIEDFEHRKVFVCAWNNVLLWKYHLKRIYNYGNAPRAYCLILKQKQITFYAKGKPLNCCSVVRYSFLLLNQIKGYSFILTITELQNNKQPRELQNLTNLPTHIYRRNFSLKWLIVTKVGATKRYSFCLEEKLCIWKVRKENLLNKRATMMKFQQITNKKIRRYFYIRTLRISLKISLSICVHSKENQKLFAIQTKDFIL